MPAPPFSQVKDKSDTLQPAIRSDWNTDDTGWSGYIVQPGINVVGQPTSSGTLRVAHYAWRAPRGALCMAHSA